MFYLSPIRAPNGSKEAIKKAVPSCSVKIYELSAVTFQDKVTNSEKAKTTKNFKDHIVQTALILLICNMTSRELPKQIRKKAAIRSGVPFIKLINVLLTAL